MRLLFIGLFIGLAVGVSASIVVPRFAGPYLPPAIKPGTSVEGTVVAKQREADRLLLTVRAPDGSILVTFTKKIPEIDLLVEQTDTIVLSMRQYKPFIHDPEILRVAKVEPDTGSAGAEPVRDAAHPPEPAGVPESP